MFRILLVVLSLHLALPAAADEISCEPKLAEPLVIPARWGLRRAEVDAFIAVRPSLYSVFQTLVRVEKFVDDGANLEFLDLLGAYVGVGLVPDQFPGQKLENPELQRQAQMEALNELGWHLGLIENRLAPDELVTLGAALGPITPPAAVDPVARIKDVSVEPKLNRWAELNREKLPSFDALLMQSNAVQTGVINMAVAPVNLDRSKIPHLVHQLKARLLGLRGEEEPNDKFALDMVERFARRDIDRWMRTEGGARMRTRQEATRAFAEAQNLFVTHALLNFIAVFGGYLEYEAPTLRHSPLGVMQALEQFLMRDAFIDQNLAPTLRRMIAVVLLDAPTVPGRKVQKIARAFLDTCLRDLREVFKDFRARERREPSVEGPSREQRKREYAERIAGGMAGADDRPAAPLALPEAPKPVERDLWDELLDPARSLDEARALAREKLVANQAIALNFRVSGYRYEVEFAPGLIARLLDPEPGEPADFRDWLEAMKFGPARAVGQRGWKKRSVAFRGVYDWEIKVLNSPLRLLGYKRVGKVWRFETIEDPH